MKCGVMLELGDCLNKRTSSLNDELHVSLNRLSANIFSRLIQVFDRHGYELAKYLISLQL